MNIINKMRRWVQSLFPIKNIQTALDIDVALSPEMMGMIDTWQKCWTGNADWINKYTASLRLEKSVTREFANVVLNEMTAKVSNPKLDKLFQASLKDINEEFQKGLASGAMVIKPLGGSKVQYVPQSGFIPVEYDVEKRLVKVIFPDFKQFGDYYYTRLEYHDLDPQKGLTVTNRAFRSSTPGSLGKEISLAEVEEWSQFNSYALYPLMKRPAFGYYRNPIANTIDGSPAGISIFETAIETIKKADKQFGRIEWEFESGERVIHIDEAALRPNKNEKTELPETFGRLYRGIDVGTDELYKEFSPAFRQADLLAGLDAYKREIEFQVGLSYGDISNPQTVDKTATEIKSSKKRKYNTVTAIQNNLESCLDDFVYALAFLNQMATQNYDFICDFKDSVLVDDETERTQDRQDVSMGVMPLWEYRMKWYGEDENTAKTMTSDSTAEVVD